MKVCVTTYEKNIINQIGKFIDNIKPFDGIEIELNDNIDLSEVPFNYKLENSKIIKVDTIKNITQ